jgi:hypothetical protein
MAWGLFIGVLGSIFSYIALTALFIWSLLIGLATWFYERITSLMSNTLIVFFIVLLIVFGTGQVLRNFQSDTMSTFDIIWECVGTPATQFGESTMVVFARTPFQFGVAKYNDMWLYLRDCVSEFIDDLKALNLGNFANISAYSDIIGAMYRVWKCGFSTPINVPSWDIPFFTDQIEAIYRVYFCYTDLVYDAFQSAVNLNFTNGACQWCALDPNAVCVLRQNVPGFPPAPGPSCTGCINFECRATHCVALHYDLLTKPFQILSGTDWTFMFDATASAFCCILGQTWRPPFWLFIGLIDGCIPFNPFDIRNFIINDWLFPLVACFDDFIKTITFNFLSNFFELIFAVFFDFIQIVIDTITTTIDCIALPAFYNCIAGYPGNCAFGAEGSATAGLSSCFSTFGQCVINGNIPNDIDPAPLFQPAPLPFIFLTAIPFMFIPLDTVVCNAVGLQTCLFDSTPPPGPLTLPQCPTGGLLCGFIPFPIDLLVCTLNCFKGRVPIVAPIIDPINTALNGILSAFTYVCGLITTIIAQLATLQDLFNSLKSIVDGITGGGGGIIASCFIVCLKSDMHGIQLSSENLEDQWSHILNSYNVSNSTTCGRILWSQNPNTVDKNHWGNYAVYYSCISLLKIGIGYQEKYPDDVNKNDFLNMTSLPDAFNLTFQRMYEERLENMTKQQQNNTQRYTFRELRSMPYNLVPEDMKIHKIVADREPLFQKMFGPVSSSSIIDEEYDKLPQEKKVTFMNLLEGLWDSFKNTTYYDIIKGYHRDHNYLKNAMLKRHGWYPGMRGKKRVISKENDINTDNTKLRLVENINTLEPSGDFYSKENTWNRKKEEQDFVNAINNLYLRFSSAMVHEYKLNGPKRPWYTYKDAGKYGNPDVFKEDEYPLKFVDDKTKLRQLKREHELQLQSQDYEYTLYTEKDMKEKSQHFKKSSEFFAANANLVKTVFDKIAGDGTFTSRLINRYDIKYWPSIQKISMFAQAIKNNEWENIEKVSAGEKGYLVDEGFVSSEYYMKVMESKTFRKRGSILDIVTGQYNPREPHELGPLLTNPGKSNSKPFIPNLDEMRSVLVRKQKQRLVEEFNITTNFSQLNSTQRNEIINFNNPVSNVIFSFMEWVINNVIGGIFRFFGIPFHNINIPKLINDFLEFFVSDDIPSNIFNQGKKFVKKFFKNCAVPEDFNGTNLYNPICWPLLDETTLNWIQQGDHSKVPIQIPWPNILINKECKNVYNGRPNLFDSWEKSDNCKIDSNSSIRPFCDTSTCDYCERSYKSCSSVGMTDVLDNGLYVLGVIPPLLDEFFRGGLSSRTTENIIVIYYTPTIIISIVTVWGIPALLLVWATWGQLAVGYMGWVPDVVFDSFFEGPGGGLPWGLVMIYILIAYGVIVTQAPAASKALEIVIYVLVIPIVIWSVNYLMIAVGSGGIPSFADNFNINRGISDIATFLNEAPTPLKYLDWTWLSKKADRFAYTSLSDIPAVDTFCFFWTMDNIALLVFFAYFTYSMILMLWALFLPILVYILGIITIIIELLAKIRVWRLRQDVNDNESWKEEINEKFKKENERLKSKIKDLKYKIETFFTTSPSRSSNNTIIDESVLNIDSNSLQVGMEIPRKRKPKIPIPEEKKDKQQ